MSKIFRAGKRPKQFSRAQALQNVHTELILVAHALLNMLPKYVFLGVLIFTAL